MQSDHPFSSKWPFLHYSIIVQAYGQLPPLLACQISRGWGTSIRKGQDVTNYVYVINITELWSQISTHI